MKKTILVNASDLNTVLGYLWHDEEKDYEANPVPQHIFLVLKRLKECRHES